MPSLKILHKKRDKDRKEGVLYLQIINSRADKTEISLKVKLNQDDWDSLRQKIKSKNRQSSKLNIYLRNEKNAYESLINDKLAKGIPFTVKDIVRERKSQINGMVKKGDFIDFFENYVESNPENLRYNTMKSYITCLNN